MAPAGAEHCAGCMLCLLMLRSSVDLNAQVAPPSYCCPLCMRPCASTYAPAVPAVPAGVGRACSACCVSCACFACGTVGRACSACCVSCACCACCACHCTLAGIWRAACCLVSVTWHIEPAVPAVHAAPAAPSCVCRDLAGGLVSSVIDLANFQAAPISLQGLSEGNVSMLQVGNQYRG